jgi:hypothetical protein
MRRKKAQPAKFKPGDRVAERPKVTAIPGLSKETLQKIQIHRTQRYGVVIDVFIKPTKTPTRGTMNNKFVKVLWDGLQTPSDHAQMRLVREEELDDLVKSYREMIGG